MAVDTRRIAETARLAASPIGRFALGPRRGRARRPLASSSKRRRHLAASFRNLELSFAPSPADRACAQLGARIEQPSSRSSTVSCRGVGNSGEGWRCDFIGGRLRASRFRQISRRDARSLASPARGEGFEFGARGEGGAIHRVLATRVKKKSSGEGGRIVGTVRRGVSRWRR